MRYSEFRIVEQETQQEGGLRAGPPYPNDQRQAVSAMQRRLEELGYSVGSTGVDGKYGPRTSRAVRAFKQDNNIQGDGLSMSADDLQKLRTATRVERPTSTGNGRAFTPQDMEALDFGGARNDDAKTAAERYLGRELSDQEWNYLVRATVAEASPNEREQAAVMAVILNRVRSDSYPDDVVSVLTQRNQFQAVTGTQYDPGPSRNFRSPTQRQIASVVQAAIDHLASSNRSWLNFTANDPRAYGRGTNIGFRSQVAQAPGSRVIGGTVFGTV